MLNKTPKELPVVTELVLSKTRLGVLLFVLLVIVGLLAIQNHGEATKLHTPNSVLNIEIVDDNESRRLGLSDSDYIGNNEGMLFIFDDAKISNCFWMKDMNFAIDMVWMDEQKKVINVIQNVGPETYPNTFCPEAPAKYGLEIKAGSASNIGIATGVTLRF